MATLDISLASLEAEQSYQNRSLEKKRGRAPSLGRPIFVDYPLGCNHQRVVFPLVRVDIYPN